ncbi:Cytochrome b-c1 complex subunit 6 [Dirofilaria immitis]|nr:Cytochrome b-c1 complex subunit 6 [Dirofilaria immitis]
MGDDNEETQPSAVDEEEVVDALIKFREECIAQTGKWKKLLDECTERVNSKISTKESCHYEMVDYIQALDHCKYLIIDDIFGSCGDLYCADGNASCEKQLDNVYVF